jgi:MerR family transcriptional regulator, thiopeptide resistance regulator
MTTDVLAGEAWTVGQVADELGVTVRTLHHYDEIGLLRPSERSRAGYRLYTTADLERLQNIVVYRRLGFALEEIGRLLDAGGADLQEHLRRQRAAVVNQIDELNGLVCAIDRALEKEMSGLQLTREEQRELFGDGYSEDYAVEAEDRWGDTDAWKESARRTSRYTKADWIAIKAEMEAVSAAFVAAKRSGMPSDSAVAMDAAEQHRRHIDERFYSIGPQFHRNLADMYVSDPRFTKTYDDLEPGLATYVRDAVHANADRLEA